MKSRQPLTSIVQKYFENDPVSASRMLETMDDEDAAAILTSLSAGIAATVVNQLNDSYAALILEKLPRSFLEKIANSIEPEKGASIFLQIPDEKRRELLEAFEEKKKKEIQELLSYPAGSAGRMMTTRVVAFHSDLKVKDAIQKIRKLSVKGFPASYIYVVDKGHKLVGIMNMRDMLLAQDNGTLESNMRKSVYAVNCFADMAQMADELIARKYFAVPVVDNENRLLGAVQVEKLLEDAQEAASEDILKMFGASADERAFSPVSFSLRTRLPWLHVNLLTAFLAASVVSLFEDIIAKVTALAVFLPVVAGQGGNAGAQSLAVVMRGLVMREIPRDMTMKLIRKETKVGFFNGLVIGVVTGLVAWMWQGNPALGLVIGFGMVVNMVAAGFSGAIIPLTMKTLGMDPAQSSSIVLTTITDVVGFFAFLGFAVIFQDYLL